MASIIFPGRSPSVEPPGPGCRYWVGSAVRIDHFFDLDCVVKDTDGATQAFLKELVHRALQFAVEGGRTEDARVLPTTGDFSSALAAFDSNSTRAITGFRVDQC